MRISIFLLFLAILFVGGGFYLGGAILSGAALGIILMACLLFYFAGGFRTRS
jgi:hypothetical protein